jgi:hypothetical protein
MNQEGRNSSPTESESTPDLQRAIEAVVLELAHILSDYRDAFVVSGGFALHLLFPPQGTRRSMNTANAAEDEPEPFERLTKDVDLILNVLMLEDRFDDNVPAIGELLIQNNYQQEHLKRYWIRSVNLPRFVAPVTVPVEFLAPGRFADLAAGSAILEHMSALQEVVPAPLGGIDLVLLQPQTVMLSGLTPNNVPLDNVPVQVVDLAMLILVKAIAFQDRLSKHDRDPEGEKHLFHAAKHAYDISECLRRYPGRMEALADRLAPLWLTQFGPEQPLIDDALECLRTHFSSPTAEGPRRMVLETRYQFDNDNDKRVAQQQTARRVQQLLRLLDDCLTAIL